MFDRIQPVITGFFLIIFGFGVLSYAQPIRIDVSGAEYIEPQTRTDSVNHRLYWSSDVYEIYPSIDFKVSYFIPSIGFEPVIHSNFGYKSLLLDAGIEKPFKIVFATLTPGLGIGYDWQDYRFTRFGASDVTFTHNDVIYWLGVSLYTPLLKFIDLTAGYRMIFKKKQTMEQTDAFVNHVLDVSNPRHLLTGGISIRLGKVKKNK